VIARPILNAVASSAMRIHPPSSIANFVTGTFEVEAMDAARKLRKSFASSIEEAQSLVRRCAEPRPAGDQVKAAVRRASQRLEIPFSRTRDIWYGDARRINADEMDRLRREAEKAELAQAVAAIEFLRNKILASPSSASHLVITSLHAALLAFQRDTVGELASSA
jgi:hypothetical protein